MLKYITIALAFLLALLDYIAYRRILRSKANKLTKVLFTAVVIALDIIPFSVPLLMFVFNNDDNGTLMIRISMILLTVFIVLTLCRIVLYIFWLPTSKRRWSYTGVIFSFATFILLMYGVFVTRTDYKVNEIELVYDNLPESFNGYRIAFMSDIHIGSMYNAGAELDEIARIVSELNTELLLIGGDLVNIHHSELTPSVLEKLSLFNNNQRVLAVLGNHDTGAYLKDSVTTPRSVNKKLVEAKLKGIGWILLRDSTLFVNNGSDSISITGIDYTDELLEFKHNFNNIKDYDVSHIYSGIDEKVFNITISHLPQLWHVLCDNDYSDLTLSGHIHAMQFKYDIFGLSFSPAAFLYDEWSGLYERKNGKLYINDGIGTVGFFARLGARPEITVITLNRAE